MKLSSVILFFLFFTCFSIPVKAGTDNAPLKIHFKKGHPQKLYLYSFYGINTTLIDSSSVSSTGNFSFNTDKFATGFYRIKASDTNYVDVILSGKEHVVLTVNEFSLKAGTEIESSRENKALWKLKSERMSYNKKKNAYNKLLTEFKNDPVRCSAIRHSLDSLERAFNAFALQLFNNNQDTYFATTNKVIISPVYTHTALLHGKFKSDTFAFMKENFFSNIDFSKEELVHSTLLPNQYMKYFEKYTEYDEKGFYNSIDLILSKAKANKAVYDLTLDFMLKLFNESGPEVVFEYIVEKYYNANTCGNDYSEKADRMKGLKPGNKLPPIAISGYTPFDSLSAVYSKNKLTVLYFWSSHCGFCAESVPLLKKIYADRHVKGLEVVGFSLDEKEADWNNYIRDNNLEWLNYNELKGWDSGVVRSLMVNRTPTFFLVDSQGVIFGKNYNFTEMEKMISNFFDKP